MIISIKKRAIIFGLIFLVFFSLSANTVFAEKLSMQIERLYDDNVNFKIVIYDNNNNKIDGEADYVIKDYSDDIVGNGESSSGEQISFKLPPNPVVGPWKIIASYKDKSITELFNVGDIKRADIRLEKSNLVIKNTGNVAYDNKILITIGDNYQSQTVYLAIGETRKLRLTAPAGEYTVKVDDGSSNKNLVFRGVSLTGNVIGLESVIEGNFFQKYPIVSVFLVVVFIAFFVLSFIVRRRASLRLKGRKK